MMDLIRLDDGPRKPPVIPDMSDMLQPPKLLVPDASFILNSPTTNGSDEMKSKTTSDNSKSSKPKFFQKSNSLLKEATLNSTLSSLLTSNTSPCGIKSVQTDIDGDSISLLHKISVSTEKTQAMFTDLLTRLDAQERQMSGLQNQMQMMITLQKKHMETLSSEMKSNGANETKLKASKNSNRKEQSARKSCSKSPVAGPVPAATEESHLIDLQDDTQDSKSPKNKQHVEAEVTNTSSPSHNNAKGRVNFQCDIDQLKTNKKNDEDSEDDDDMNFFKDIRDKMPVKNNSESSRSLEDILESPESVSGSSPEVVESQLNDLNPKDFAPTTTFYDHVLGNVNKLLERNKKDYDEVLRNRKKRVDQLRVDSSKPDENRQPPFDHTLEHQLCCTPVKSCTPHREENITPLATRNKSNAVENMAQDHPESRNFGNYMIQQNVYNSIYVPPVQKKQQFCPNNVDENSLDYLYKKYISDAHHYQEPRRQEPTAPEVGSGADNYSFMTLSYLHRHGLLNDRNNSQNAVGQNQPAYGGQNQQAYGGQPLTSGRGWHLHDDLDPARQCIPKYKSPEIGNFDERIFTPADYESDMLQVFSNVPMTQDNILDITGLKQQAKLL